MGRSIYINNIIWGVSFRNRATVAATSCENKLRGGAGECDTTSRLVGPEPGRWEGDGRGSQTPVHTDESGAAWSRKIKEVQAVGRRGGGDIRLSITVTVLLRNDNAKMEVDSHRTADEIRGHGQSY